MAIVSALDEFASRVRKTVGEVMPKDDVYIDVTFGLVPHPSQGVIPAVVVNLMSSSGIIGSMHQGYLFFNWGEILTGNGLLDKVREFADSLAKVRSEVASGSPS